MVEVSFQKRPYEAERERNEQIYFEARMLAWETGVVPFFT